MPLATWREVEMMKKLIPMGAQAGGSILASAKMHEIYEATHKDGSEILQKSARIHYTMA